MSPSGPLQETPPDPPHPGGRLGRRARIALILLTVAALAVAGGIYLTTRDSPEQLDRADVSKIAAGVTKKAVDDLRSAPPSSATAYQRILPSLVEIEAEREGATTTGTGLGAGVIVNRNGSILTALHVVEGAQRIRVSFVDGSTSTADIASTDPENDIAVLMPQQGPEVIVPAVLGGAGQVGDDAFAVGHPLGYVGTLTSGVISGLDRTVEVPDGKTLHGLIQFDAAVNPGNSGGPLLDRNGQVIGIVTALANPTATATHDGYFIGIGFAVPIGAAGGAANAPSK